MNLRAHSGIVMILTVFAAVAVQSSQAQTFSTLYSFSCGTDGAHPYGGLVRDASGNLYGTTYYGGTSGKGTVFEVPATGKKTTLYSFTGKDDGAYPAAGLILDSAGNLYGTTVAGGNSALGVVYKLTPSKVQTVLHSFSGSPGDGSDPNAALVADSAGNFYGTTVTGGAHGAGTVFKVTPAGLETVLYSFSGPPADGSGPTSGLIVNAAGTTLYGTTLNGGANDFGTVFSLTTTGTETLLFSFNGDEGSGPIANLLEDKAGNLYGTAYADGSSANGVAFRINPAGQFSVVFSFDGHLQGRDPSVGMVDSSGNLFGATVFGGVGQCRASGCGLIFELSGGKQTILHNFSGFPAEGSNPHGGSSLISDTSGNLYGTTYGGGPSDCGTVFKLVP